MFRRFFVALSMVASLAWLSVGTASAQERLDLSNIDFSATVLNNAAVPAIRLADLDQIAFPIPPVQARKSSSSPLMASLYASTALVQALDVHSTLSAFRAGAVEGNPLIAGVARNRGAFIATKAAVAAGTILATRHLAKKNKVAAVVAMVAINSAYAMVIRHNYRIARGR